MVKSRRITHTALKTPLRNGTIYFRRFLLLRLFFETSDFGTAINRRVSSVIFSIGDGARFGRGVRSLIASSGPEAGVYG